MTERIGKPIEKSRARRKLGELYERGDLSAIYQLSLLERDDGKEPEADVLLNKCREILAGQNGSAPKLMLNELKLYDFRKFEELNITFGQKLTVLVGINGSGKTTIADAVVNTLKALKSGFEGKINTGTLMNRSDVRLKGTGSAEIHANFRFDSNEAKYNLKLAKSAKGKEKQTKSEVEEIRYVTDMYRAVNDRSGISLPVLAFYSIQRKGLADSKYDFKWDGRNRFNAYDKSLDGLANFKDFIEWFDIISNQARAADTVIDPEGQQALNELKFIEKILSKLDSSSKQYGDLLELRNERELRFIPDARSLEPVHRAEKVRQSLSDALSIFLSKDSKENTRLRLNYQENARVLEALLQDNGDWINVELLSDGQKVVLAMVAELVRRMHMLNPDMDDPLQGHGIVVIDEIDLHLHPAWQQTILPNLTRTFPNIQFIVTTHSPQVLSTVKRENIRIIGTDAKGKIIAEQPLAMTYGEPSGDVMHSVMLVDPQPPVAEKAELQRLTEWVDQGQYDEQQAVELMGKLEVALGAQHPQLLRLKRSIQRQKGLKE